MASLGSTSELRNLLLSRKESSLPPAEACATVTQRIKTAEIPTQGIKEQDKAQVDIPQCLPGLDLTALFHHWQ